MKTKVYYLHSFNQIGELIYQMRRDCNVTIEKLAELINVDPRSIRFYQSGERYPSMDHLQKIVKALNVQLQIIIS